MDLITFLRQRIQQPLPGLDVQMTMAPPIRRHHEPIPADARLSAVMLLLYPHQGTWTLPLMRRAQDGRVHSGQISLPGGKYEEVDPDFLQTALRETEEEFGIQRESISVLGSLTEIYIPPSRFMVYPKVGMLPERPVFRADPREVAEIIEVDVFQFLEDRRKSIHRVHASGGGFLEAPGYTLNSGELVWGGTAMILAELAHLLREWKEVFQYVATFDTDLT